MFDKSCRQLGQGLVVGPADRAVFGITSCNVIVIVKRAMSEMNENVKFLLFIAYLLIAPG